MSYQAPPPAVTNDALALPPGFAPFQPVGGPFMDTNGPLYLLHQTILIVTAVALRPLMLSAGLEAAVVVALTFAGGFAAWQLARRVSGLRPWMGLPAWPPAPARQRAAAPSA